MIDVCAVIERETGQKVTESTRLDDLGLDSLDFLDLILAIGNSAGQQIPDESIPHINRVGDIIRILDGEL